MLLLFKFCQGTSFCGTTNNPCFRCLVMSPLGFALTLRDLRLRHYYLNIWRFEQQGSEIFVVIGREHVMLRVRDLETQRAEIQVG